MKSLVSYNGKVYGAMNSTDVQLIYYSHEAVQEGRSAGDVAAAQLAGRALGGPRHQPRADSGVVPLWIYTGPGRRGGLGLPRIRGLPQRHQATASYDYTTHKWEISGPGFTATWNLLAQMQPLEEPESMWSNPNADATVALTLMPHQQVGIVFDGSWVATAYVPGGLATVAGIHQCLRRGQPAAPRRGRHRATTNQSGGWALSVPGLAPHPSLSQAFIEAASIRLPSSPTSTRQRATCRRGPTSSAQPAWLASVKVNPVSQLRVGPAALHDVPTQPPGLRPGLERDSAADRTRSPRAPSTPSQAAASVRQRGHARSSGSGERGANEEMSQVVDLSPGVPPGRTGRAAHRRTAKNVTVETPLRRRVDGPVRWSLPMLVVVLVFMGWPAIWTFVLSFTNMTVTGPTATHYQFVGLANYRQLFSTGSGLVDSVGKSIYYLVVSGYLGQAVLGFLLAYFLSRSDLRRRAPPSAPSSSWRGCIPEIVTSYMWFVLLSDGGGHAAGVPPVRPATTRVGWSPTRCSP